jgi:ArsR family transcriptional regulator
MGDRRDPWADEANLFKALSHPVRLRIVNSLDDGARCVTDLRELVGIPQPSVSQHLAKLKDAGLVASCSNGPLRCYYLLEPELVHRLLKALEKRRGARLRKRASVIAEAQRRRINAAPK